MLTPFSSEDSNGTYDSCSDEPSFESTSTFSDNGEIIRNWVGHVVISIDDFLYGLDECDEFEDATGRVYRDFTTWICYNGDTSEDITDDVRSRLEGLSMQVFDSYTGFLEYRKNWNKTNGISRDDVQYRGYEHDCIIDEVHWKRSF